MATLRQTTSKATQTHIIIMITDAYNRFQFDQPIQAGALDKSGFSICSNGTLALDGSAIWYQCYSGGFYNLYDESQGKQCNPIYIYAQSSGGSSSQTGAVTQASDGQPAASTQVSAPAVTQLTDGQPQAPTSQAPAPVVSQLSDGQPQAPVSQAPAPVVSQLSDGQPQVPTAAPAPVVSQLSDGQPQVPTAAPAPSVPAPSAPAPSAPAPSAPAPPTGNPVSQISDGQIQAPTAAPVPSAPLVSQIPDGQPQAPVSGAGNYTAPNATSTSPVEFPGAATTPMAAAGAIAAGLMAMVAML
jgi:hypothetical protein